MSRRLSGASALTFAWLSILPGAQLAAQEGFVFWPDADYDPAIPSFESVLRLS